MIKACIFDMDGTTVNSLDSIAYFANNALKKFGLPAIETEKYKLLVGNGAKVLVKRMIETVGAPEELTESVLNEYNSTYDNDFLYLAHPYENITELLTRLKEMNITSAILSNKPHSTAKKVSDALFGDELIKICQGGIDGTPLKPSPDGVFKLLDRLGVKKHECLYIGDTATDMKTGKNAGLYTIGVLWGFRSREELEEANADVIISSPLQIIDIINKMA
ncbi:MAG: HAD family hydrolase [Clostridia bacterium]|nr:HAD family hydrolase [Clostridia bacterium]